MKTLSQQLYTLLRTLAESGVRINCMYISNEVRQRLMTELDVLPQETACSLTDMFNGTRLIVDSMLPDDVIVPVDWRGRVLQAIKVTL